MNRVLMKYRGKKIGKHTSDRCKLKKNLNVDQLYCCGIAYTEYNIFKCKIFGNI